MSMARHESRPARRDDLTGSQRDTASAVKPREAPREVTAAPSAQVAEPPPPIPRTMAERLLVARERLRVAAEAGLRIRAYEVALELDLSEFHFARQFRAAFARSPHVFYDEVRAERARVLLREGMREGDVARCMGFRRPAELRALLSKRTATAGPVPIAEVAEVAEPP